MLYYIPIRDILGTRSRAGRDSNTSIRVCVAAWPPFFGRVRRRAFVGLRRGRASLSGSALFRTSKKPLPLFPLRAAAGRWRGSLSIGLRGSGEGRATAL